MLPTSQACALFSLLPLLRCVQFLFAPLSLSPLTPPSAPSSSSPHPAGPFVEPVNWREWGLLDYPKVVKTPMDLGTVKAKLDKGEYSSPKEFRHDANLVWTNCMTYNADGSEYYLIAHNLKKVFEEKYAKMIREDEEPQDLARPATLVDKKMFSQNIYNISPEDLGKIVQILDQRCEVRERERGRTCVCFRVPCCFCAHLLALATSPASNCSPASRRLTQRTLRLTLTQSTLALSGWWMPLPRTACLEARRPPGDSAWRPRRSEACVACSLS